MARKRAATPEEELFRRLENLESRVGAIEEHTVHNARLKPEDQQAFVHRVFGQSSRRAQVFLAANRKRSVNQIAAHLGMQQQNVSIELGRLQGEGLLTVETAGSTSHWMATKVAATIGVVDILTKKFKLTKDGLKKPSAV